ncbi:MAG TPA: hypothetical protein VJS92_02535 [Candidatus Polarisedimenticolaceae bacterium]|nr:hypothetical protein [Candidatus Polarisedimenticolaceae bacterium]
MTETDAGGEAPLDVSLFQQVDIRVGVVRLVESAEGTRIPSYRLVIDFGPDIGTRTSIAQATHYPPEALEGKQVLAVINLKPRQIGPHRSEVLTLGVPTADRGTALIVPDVPAIVGGRLF